MAETGHEDLKRGREGSDTEETPAKVSRSEEEAFARGLVYMTSETYRHVLGCFPKIVNRVCEPPLSLSVSLMNALSPGRIGHYRQNRKTFVLHHVGPSETHAPFRLFGSSIVKKKTLGIHRRLSRQS